MPFAVGLQENLEIRRAQVAAEFGRGESLREVLSRHLQIVEAMAEPGLITSILLLSHDRKRLTHGAAPSLPRSYCEAIDNSEIGPNAGSCGTAAYLGRPVYVSDIANDPLWAAYRHLALPHGLRSCWSTPIRDKGDTVIGTFAIYRATLGEPTLQEIKAIELITEHVAQAIILARDVQDLEPLDGSGGIPRLRLVSNIDPEPDAGPDQRARLLEMIQLLEAKAAELEHHADRSQSEVTARKLKDAATLSRKLIASLAHHVEPGASPARDT